MEKGGPCLAWPCWPPPCHPGCSSAPPPSISPTDPLKRGLSFTDAAEIIGQTRTSLDPKGQTPSSHSCHSSHFLLFILPSAHAKATPPFVILSHGQQQWAEVRLNPSTSHPLLHSHYRSLTEAAIFPPEHVISPLWRPAGTNYLMLGASLPNQSITLQSAIFQKLEAFKTPHLPAGFHLKRAHCCRVIAVL